MQADTECNANNECNLDDVACTDDSGAYSDVACTELQEPNYANALQQREQSLFLAMQDLRKLRSELERLSKSEQWYKEELRSQKSTRLETLERLYTQERKYMLENQRLQQECLSMYSKCTELESEMEALREKPTTGSDVYPSNETQCDVEFKLKQQQTVISDQVQLIAVLRNQKKQLLADMQRLGEEHNDKQLALQTAMAHIEQENNRMTEKCKLLLDTKRDLEACLKLKDANTQSLNEEKEKLQKVVCDLNETLQAQERLLALKEQQFLDLKTEFNMNLSETVNADEVHRLSLAYHEDVNAKTYEIKTLRVTLQQLQDELVTKGELEARNELHQRTIEQLNFALDAQNFEFENLRVIDNAKTQQISELSFCLDRLRVEKEAAQGNLRETQEKTKKAEQELISLHQQYAEMCAISERDKFQLELQEIEDRKLKCQSQCDAKEIQQLRERLRDNLLKTAMLSAKISTVENQLECQSRDVQNYRQTLLEKNAALNAVQEEHAQLKEKLDSIDSRRPEPQITLEQETILETQTCEHESSIAIYKVPAVNASMQTDMPESQTDKELMRLRYKIQELELKLNSVNAEKSKTVVLLQSLLERQNEKMKSINSSHNDWEELLMAITAMQSIEADMRHQLSLKTAEFEELNTLFATQNEELFNMQQLAYMSECKRAEEFRQLREAFQKQVQTLHAEKTNEKESLQCELASLQLQLNKSLADRNATKVRVQGLESELVKFKQISIAEPISSSHCHSYHDVSECVCVLSKWLDAECDQQSDCHDSNILVKNIKKLLKSAKLTKMVKQSEFELKQQTEGLRFKYEQSQERIKNLEMSLVAERKKFESSDLGKTSARVSDALEPAHEVANLIDDYKKLIQQSADATGRARTGAILDLIERSNRCVPTLSKLEASVCDFRADVQELANILHIVDINNCPMDMYSSDGIPSLMEELRAVTNKF